jgi:hypothetical protein
LGNETWRWIYPPHQPFDTTSSQVFVIFTIFYYFPTLVEGRLLRVFELLLASALVALRVYREKGKAVVPRRT